MNGAFEYYFYGTFCLSTLNSFHKSFHFWLINLLQSCLLFNEHSLLPKTSLLSLVRCSLFCKGSFVDKLLAETSFCHNNRETFEGAKSSGALLKKYSESFYGKTSFQQDHFWQHTSLLLAAFPPTNLLISS